MISNAHMRQLTASLYSAHGDSITQRVSINWPLSKLTSFKHYHENERNPGQVSTNCPHFPSSSIVLYILMVCRTHVDVCGQLIMMFVIVLQQRRSGHRRFINAVSLFTFHHRGIGSIFCYLAKHRKYNN